MVMLPLAAVSHAVAPVVMDTNRPEDEDHLETRTYQQHWGLSFAAIEARSVLLSLLADDRGPIVRLGGKTVGPEE